MSDTLMWEARAEAGRRGELLGYVEESVLPGLRADPACLEATVYLGGEDRVVLIAHFTDAPPRLPAPPEELVARPVHQWPFQRYMRC